MESRTQPPNRARGTWAGLMLMPLKPLPEQERMMIGVFSPDLN
jgi:hypothetical protein